MNITKSEAQASLANINEAIAQTRKAIAHGAAAPLLILWGLIWMIGYSGTHFFPRSAGWLWMLLISLGTVLSWWLGWHLRSPVKSPHDAKIGFFWLILFGYAT